MLKLAIFTKAARKGFDAEQCLAITAVILISLFLSFLFIGLPIIFIIGAFKSMHGVVAMDYIGGGGFGVALSYVVSITYLAISTVEHFRPSEPRHRSYDPEKNREEYEDYEKKLKCFNKVKKMVILITGLLVSFLVILSLFAIKFWAGTVLSGIVLAIIGILSILMILGSLIVMVTGVLE